MIDSSNISLTSESFRHLRAGEFAEAADVWRHEGLKKGVEAGLHSLAHLSLGRWALQELAGGMVEDERLQTNIGSLALAGPTGIAPGWDKTGKSILAWQALGARHITVGAVTLHPQQGNPMPRLRTFDNRVGDHGVRLSLNSYGFWNPGVDTVVGNVHRERDSGNVEIPVIMQVTANKEMYEPKNHRRLPKVLADTVRRALPVADGISLGLSSPNTIGMREAQAYDFLYEIIMPIREIIGEQMPLIYKGDADGGEERLNIYAHLVQVGGPNVLELINSTGLAALKAKYKAEELPGGLAGSDPDYQDMAVEAVHYLYEAVGDKADIIGCGGVNDSGPALRLIHAGASAIGINTAVRQHGTKAIMRVEKGIVRELDQRPVGTRLSNIVGLHTARGPKIKRAA